MDSVATMPEFTERENLMSMYSDAYKDAYGIRPRGDISHISDSDMISEIEYFCKVAAENAERERVFAEKRVNDFKNLIKKTIEMGAGDEATALRWIIDAENDVFYNSQDVESFVWNYGILFTDYGRELVKKLNNILF